MTIIDRVNENERIIKGLLETLRGNLNNERIEFNKQPNNWKYLATLGHTKNKLEELLSYFENSGN